ncbi:protein vein isoform X3 [Planococcus citri]|uniref:protein vein isoform X3 n=1 Tax=Planococcus citri TaxID=170843 RepID=UPI0031F966AB
MQNFARKSSSVASSDPSMPRIEATTECYLDQDDDDDCSDGEEDGVKKLKNRRKLKRHEYRLRCKELISNFKIPYLRISPNPFSIAFLILVIISSDVWPHTKSSLYVSCTPVLFRHHHNYNKMLTTKVNQQQNVSKSVNNLNNLMNDVNNIAAVDPAAAVATSSNVTSLSIYDKSSSTSLWQRQQRSQQQQLDAQHNTLLQYYGRPNNSNMDISNYNSNNLFQNTVNSTGEMFLQSQSSSSTSLETSSEQPPHQQPEFLLKRRRIGRSYKPYRISDTTNNNNNNNNNVLAATNNATSSALSAASAPYAAPPAPAPAPVADDYSSSSGSSNGSGSSKNSGQSRSFSKSSSTTSSLISPCSHVGDETNEISARAYMAETIFEGKVGSKSSVRDPGGRYGVTFVVQHVHKDQSNGQNSLRIRTQVRLYFKQKLTTTKPTAHCVQRYNYTRRPGDLTKANIKRGRRYIVFVNGIGPHNYTILGEPVPKTKRNLQAVRDVLCRNCVRQIGVWGLKNVSVDVGKPLQLVCRVKGNPLPALQWFKDGSPIIVNSRLRIQYKKKRSLLVIPEVRNSDAGRYECRGMGVQSISPVSSSATVNINTRVNNNLWPLAGKPCPMDLVYCLNGGSCTFYETIGEFTCQCADGFNGARCESKDVINSNNVTIDTLKKTPRFHQIPYKKPSI